MAKASRLSGRNPAEVLIFSGLVEGARLNIESCLAVVLSFSLNPDSLCAISAFSINIFSDTSII
jgi:hypothetical protein